MLFDVRLLAFDPTASGDPVDALVRVFGLDQNAARELLRRLPHVVKRGVSEEGARKLVRALDRIGAQTEVVVSSKGGANTDTSLAGRGPDASRLPAPSPAARALIHAHAQRDASAVRGQPTGSHTTRGARSRDQSLNGSTGRVEPAPIKTLADDDLEADIELRPSVVDERPARAALPRPPSAMRASQARLQVQVASPSPAAPNAPRASLAQPGPAASTDAVLLSSQGQAASAVAMTSLPQQPATVFLGMPVSLPEAAPPANLQSRGATQATAGAPQTAVGARSAATLPVWKQRAALPVFAIHGPPVEASSCVMPGTGGAKVVAWIIFVFLSVLLSVLSLGILTVVAMVLLFVAGLSHRRALAALRASALPVGQSQLPELYVCVKQFALRLGLARVPRMYVVRGPCRGLTALREGSELVLLADEETILRFAEGPKPEALSFLIAHEMARHALGYTGFTRQLLARVSPRLSCLDLISADSAAAALVTDHAIVKHALLSLLGVSRLQPHLDLDELDRVATSITREPAFWPSRFGADDGFLLSRLYHLQRGYVA